MIKVYSTKTCHFCLMLKDFLKEKKIDFEEVDISENREKAEVIFEKTGQTVVPIFEKDGEFVIGFNKPKIESLLNNL